MKLRLFAPLLLCLGGCASLPYALVDGKRTQFADPDVYDVTILAVDGHAQLDGRSEQRLEPGQHLLQIATTKQGGHSRVPYQALAIDAKPCTRYYIVARHNKRLSTEDWEVVRNGEVPLAGCVAADAPK